MYSITMNSVKAIQREPVFEISAILLRDGPGRLGPKIPPGRLEPKIPPGRAGPILKKQVWRKMTSKLVKNTLNWLQNPPKVNKRPVKLMIFPLNLIKSPSSNKVLPQVSS